MKIVSAGPSLITEMVQLSSSCAVVVGTNRIKHPMPGLDKEANSKSFIEYSGIRRDRIYSFSFVRINCSAETIMGLGSPQVFDEWFCSNYFYTMHSISVVIKKAKKLISHQIFHIYQRITFINRGLSIVHKPHVRCDALKVILFGINSNYHSQWAYSLYILGRDYFV